MGVMGTKIGTKSWSDAAQNELRKSEMPSNLTPEDVSKLGTDKVGDLLNKIADPNWVDPTKKVRTVGNDKLDKDAFMKLMLAQMKHQDPSNPLKPHEMASQLATFSQLEQLQNMNTSLEAMRDGQKPMEGFQALNLIGKEVNGDSAKIIRGKGDRDHDFTFQLGKDASEVQLKVKNSRGDLVRTVDLKSLKKGENKWVWNGKNEQGVTVPTGEYQVIAEAKSDKGKVTVGTSFSGKITGVQYTAEGPVLLVGNQTIRLRDIRKIVDPAVKQNDQNFSGAQHSALQNNKISKNMEEGAPEADLQNQGIPAEKIMNDVGLSRKMMEKIAKEVAPKDLSTKDPTQKETVMKEQAPRESAPRVNEEKGPSTASKPSPVKQMGPKGKMI